MHVCIHNLYLFLHTLIEEHLMFPCAYIYMGMYTLYTFLWMMSKHVVMPRTSEPIVGRACPHFTTSWTCILLAAPRHPFPPLGPCMSPNCTACRTYLRVGPACCNSMAGYDLLLLTPTIRNRLWKLFFGCIWVWVWTGDITPVESMLKVEVSLWSQLILTILGV